MMRLFTWLRKITTKSPYLRTRNDHATRTNFVRRTTPQLNHTFRQGKIENGAPRIGIAWLSAVPRVEIAKMPPP
jgi:hypothetical protein